MVVLDFILFVAAVLLLTMTSSFTAFRWHFYRNAHEHGSMTDRRLAEHNAASCQTDNRKDTATAGAANSKEEERSWWGD